MQDSFNHDFYITVATVLPLLYITLFLQGNLIQGFTKKIGVSYDKVTVALIDAVLDWFKGRFSIHHIGTVIRFIFFVFLIITPTVLTILATVIGGPFAIGYSFWALFYQSDTPGLRVVVMLSAFGLLVAVSWNPIGVIVHNLILSNYTEDKNPDQAKQAEQPEQPDYSAQDNATGLGWPSLPPSSR